MRVFLAKLVALTLLFFCGQSELLSQQTETKTDQVIRLTEYLGIQANPDELALLTRLQMEVESTSTDEFERVKSFHVLLLEYARQLNMDTSGLKKAIQNWSTHQIAKYNLPVFENLDYSPTPNGELGEVKKFGTGRIPVILIPEYRKNWTIFKDLIQSNLKQFTFYAITLPGYNGTNPYALPKHYDFSNRVWLDNVVSGVLALIKKRS